MDRQMDRLVDWWWGRLADWLTDGQTSGQLGWLVDRQVDRSVDWWTDRWADWLTDRLDRCPCFRGTWEVPARDSEDTRRLRADQRGSERYCVCCCLSYCLRGAVCVTAWEVLCVCYCLRGTMCVTAWEAQCALLPERYSVCYCLGETVCVTDWDWTWRISLDMTDCMWLIMRYDWVHVVYTATWLTSCGYAVTWQTTRVLLHHDMTDTRVLLHRDMTDTHVLLRCDMTDNTCFLFAVTWRKHVFYYAVTWQIILLVFCCCFLNVMTDYTCLLRCDLTDNFSILLLLFLNVMTDYTCFITLWLDRQFFYFVVVVFKCYDGLHMFYYAVTWQTILLFCCCCFLNVMTDYTCFITLWLDRQFFYFVVVVF